MQGIESVRTPCEGKSQKGLGLSVRTIRRTSSERVVNLSGILFIESIDSRQPNAIADENRERDRGTEAHLFSDY